MYYVSQVFRLVTLAENKFVIRLYLITTYLNFNKKLVFSKFALTLKSNKLYKITNKTIKLSFFLTFTNTL